ncbi:M48 family metallopeptidase [Candidatus Foliamicus sp.]
MAGGTAIGVDDCGGDGTPTEFARISVGGIPIDIVHKDIKNLHLGVYPPSGRVRVAAPLRLDEDAIRLAVGSRLEWIRRKQAEYAQQDRQTEREFVTGESHYFAGQRYRLDVIESEFRPSVSRANKRTIAMRVRPGSDRAAREAALDDWYRRQLRARLPALLTKWQRQLGVQAAEVRIRKMKTRWGSCNPDARRIWLNLELAKKPVSCLEYIVVHELAHLIERRHNARFRELMDHHLPQWRLHREALKRAPLAHAKWAY